MTEEVTGEKTELMAAPEKDAPPAPEGEKPKYTQADMDAITAKVRGGLETKLTKTQAELEKVRQAALSDDEKKLEEARKSGAAEATAQLDVVKRQAAVERSLLAKGVPEAMLERAARLIDPDAEDIPGAIEALAKDIPGLFTTKQIGFGGGGGRNADHDVPDYSPEGVKARIGQPGGKAWYEAHRGKIKQWRAEHGYPT